MFKNRSAYDLLWNAVIFYVCSNILDTISEFDKVNDPYKFGIEMLSLVSMGVAIVYLFMSLRRRKIETAPKDDE